MTHPHLEGLPNRWRTLADALRRLGERRQVCDQLTDCADELEAALAALPGGGVEYQFEIWQDGECLATGSAGTAHECGAESAHYALMYGQDGPVEVKYFERRELPTPNPHEADRNG